MRRLILACFLLLVPFSAKANPVVLDPGSLIAFGIVAICAFMVEAGLAALLLLFSALVPLRVFLTYFVLNAAIFIFLFHPMIQRGLPWQAGEVFIIGIDSVVIKTVASMDSFQGDGFKGLTWTRAALVSFAVNAFSFFVGMIASGAPWESKSF